MQEVKHHIIQRFYGWSNHEQNLHSRPQRFEQAYHTLFPTMLPIERIQRILELDSTAYNPDVVRQIEKVVEQVKREGIEAYNYKCFRERNVFTK